jgi:hypothetical protein
MKRGIVVALALLMFAGVASAPRTGKTSGLIDVLSNWQRNTTQANSLFGYAHGSLYNSMNSNYNVPDVKGWDRTVGYMASRARIMFTAEASKALSGSIWFEMDSQYYGDIRGGQPGKLSERNTFGFWSADRAAVEIKGVYIDLSLPTQDWGIPIPIQIRGGLQPLYFRPNMLISTDGAGITVSAKVDPVTIQAFWFKALEGLEWAADDADVYGLHVMADIAPVKVGGYAFYYDMKSYPFTANSALTASGTGTTTITVGTTVYHITVPVTVTTPFNQLVQGSQRAKMWWLGLYADGKLGPVDFNFDFIYDTGKVDHGNVTALEFDPYVSKDVDFSGWASRLKLDYPCDKWNFGAVGMYASGGDTKKSGSQGIPGELTSNGTYSRKWTGYVVPPGSEEGTGFSESVVFYNSWINRGSTGIAATANYDALSRGGIGGTWMAKLYGSYKFFPNWKVTLQGLYIGDTTKNGNTIGNARKYNGLLRDDNNIGWEADIISEWQIYKNIAWNVGAGYMWAGDAMEMYDAAKSSSYERVINASMKNPWQVTTCLLFTW